MPDDFLKIYRLNVLVQSHKLISQQPMCMYNFLTADDMFE